MFSVIYEILFPLMPCSSCPKSGILKIFIRVSNYLWNYCLISYLTLSHFMSLYSIVFLIMLASMATLSSGQNRPGCPAISCREAHLYASPTFGDPANCGNYLQCPDGVPVSQPCAPGSCFSTVVCNCLPCTSALVRC